jgi:hypothetical protein
MWTAHDYVSHLRQEELVVQPRTRDDDLVAIMMRTLRAREKGNRGVVAAIHREHPEMDSIAPITSILNDPTILQLSATRLSKWPNYS